MENSDWVKYAPILASLLGGGAMGAFINNWLANRKNRVPTIGILQSINCVFAPAMLVKPKVTFTIGSNEFHFETLYIVEIEIQNSPMNDYSDFDLKLTLSSFAKIIYVDCNGQDPSHEITLKEEIEFAKPSRVANFSLNPFNKKNVYHISIYATCDDKKELTKTDIIYSSKTPAKFNAMEPITETIPHY